MNGVFIKYNKVLEYLRIYNIAKEVPGVIRYTQGKISWKNLTHKSQNTGGLDPFLVPR